MAVDIESIRANYETILAAEAIKPTLTPGALEALAALVAAAERLAAVEQPGQPASAPASGEE